MLFLKNNQRTALSAVTAALLPVCGSSLTEVLQYQRRAKSPDCRGLSSMPTIYAEHAIVKWDVKGEGYGPL